MYNFIVYVVSFLAFLSMQVKALSCFDIYHVILQNTTTAFITLVIFCVTSIFITRRFIRFLGGIGYENNRKRR